MAVEIVTSERLKICKNCILFKYPKNNSEETDQKSTGNIKFGRRGCSYFNSGGWDDFPCSTGQFVDAEEKKI